MKRIELIPIDRAVQVALQEGANAFQRRFGASAGENLAATRDVVAMVLAMPAAQLPWAGYLAADRFRHELVGTCAFKGKPREGEVEIAYYTFEPFEGRGYATEMAEELLKIARESGSIELVSAHTLPEANASTHVLTKAGLRKVGDIVDPEDGPVWRWEVRLPAKSAPGAVAEVER